MRSSHHTEDWACAPLLGSLYQCYKKLRRRSANGNNFDSSVAGLQRKTMSNERDVANDPAEDDDRGLAKLLNYSWVPPGLNRDQVIDYMNQLPNDKLPRLGTAGERNREIQLRLQLPRHDFSHTAPTALKSATEKRLFAAFTAMRNEVALDVAHVNPSFSYQSECWKCHGVLHRGDVVVIAPKFGNAVAWHPACFVCASCGELLVDLTYCAKDGQIFCERHFAELWRPRCGVCDELIFAEEYTKAAGSFWHMEHFSCAHCAKSLTGHRYVLRDEKPCCIPCFEKLFANVCDGCGKAISIDAKDLAYQDKHWHEDCFLCNTCKISLVDKPFGAKLDKIYCGNCYDQAFASRCGACGEVFRAGMKKLEYKGKQWHDHCFCCALCHQVIGTKSFIPKNDDVYCNGCYEEKFATKCSKCKKVITSGGVSYKGEPWHKDCFVCANCRTSLAGQRFTSKDDKPFCAACFNELFAKRCSACQQAISGIGGAKFVSFDERHWHNDCFVCAQCHTSLVGKASPRLYTGFVTDGPDVLCAECARARIMAQQ